MLWLVLCVAVAQSDALAQMPWWSEATHYRLLVDSFKDGDGDGLGDLMGLSKQISYVKALGADSVILSPLASKSKDCTTPGLLHFTEIDHRYGSLDAFNVVLDKAKKLELKVLATLPLQTVSAASEWVSSSVEKAPGFEDWLVWKDGNADDPPPSTDQISWTWNESRNSFYATSNKEALLNLCSEGVTAALSAAQCAWFRRGVSGILLNPDFPPEQKCGEKLLGKLAADAMSCVRGANLEPPVIMVESFLKPEQSARYYADGGVGANSVLSNSLSTPERLSTSNMALEMYASILNTPDDGIVTWTTSTSKDSRIATRYGSDMIDAINLLNLVLPGAAVIQQGDELGAADTLLEWATSTNCWPSNKIPSASPFPWDDSANGGFSSAEPWLPLAPNYRYTNAKTEFANDFSHVGVVRVAAALRKSPAMGLHSEIKRLGSAIAVLRWGDTGSLLVISNVARENTEVQLMKIPGLPAEMTVAASSGGSSASVGSHLALEKTLKLAPGETVLLVGSPRHCGGPGPVDKIANKLTEGWQKLNKYFNNM